MTPLAAAWQSHAYAQLCWALAYSQEQGWPVFPCEWRPGRDFKQPLTSHGFLDASRDSAQIEAWWTRSPLALVGVPTGQASGFVVLDVDVKDPRAYGFDTLGDLGFAILPVTRMAHTSSGGLHLHFALPDREIRNTAGTKGRGIGPGLDWRGTGGYVIVPSDGSVTEHACPALPGGYSWDPHCGLDTPLAAVPAALMPRQPERVVHEPVEAVDGLSPYARAALDSACRNILAAVCGEQEFTLNSECFSIGQLAGSGAIPESFALRTLLWAASQLRDYDPRRPWRKSEIEDKVKGAFADGAARPREVRRHG